MQTRVKVFATADNPQLVLDFSQSPAFLYFFVLISLTNLNSCHSITALVPAQGVAKKTELS